MKENKKICVFIICLPAEMKNTRGTELLLSVSTVSTVMEVKPWWCKWCKSPNSAITAAHWPAAEGCSCKVWMWATMNQSWERLCIRETALPKPVLACGKSMSHSLYIIGLGNQKLKQIAIKLHLSAANLLSCEGQALHIMVCCHFSATYSYCSLV